MVTITRELVHQYVMSAKPFVESETDQFAIDLAFNLSPPQINAWYKISKQKGTVIPEIFAATDEAAEQVETWKGLIWKEIHTALCTGSRKYRKHVNAIKDNVHLLIGGIAVQVAGKVGVAVAVVAALVAALLRLAFEMGVSVFCRKFASGRPLDV